MSKIYPAILKQIILPIADKVMSTKIIASYYEIKQMQKWSKDEIEDWQNSKLQKLVQFSYNYTQYYKNLFDDNSINPNKILTKEDLKKIPILTKRDVIENFEKLVPTNINEIKHKTSSTGGSTGDPMKFLLDNNTWSFSNANNIINWERTSYRYGNKYIALGSSSINVDSKHSFKHSLYYSLKSKISLNGINMSDEVCHKYLEKIKKENIKYIYGYASAIYLLAQYAKRQMIKISIEACFPTSEILTPLYRETIEETFKCNVVNCYGAHDGGVTAFEHKTGFFEVGYNCIVGTEMKDSSLVGAALLTDLLNFAMPMINYQLGDEIIIDNNKNQSFSYNGQIINDVLGRTSDLIRMENGRILTGPGFTILFKDLPVESYSLKKTGRNTILCHVKKMKDYSIKEEEIIFKSLQKQAGRNSIIEIEYVDEFELLQSGKKQYFMSK